jgi:transcriptional regulator with XRE-family HTH domain
MGQTDHRAEVREFLSSRRARITPEQAGLPVYGGNRRVKGLRREEVAMLAGVSVDYYVRMERGNLSGASESVLDALSRALQLDEAERDHFFALARAAEPGPRRRRTPPTSVRPASLRPIMVKESQSSPAMVRILDALNRCLPGLPADVRAERADMTRQLMVHMVAERERALADDTATPRASWDDAATGLVDALVGLWLAPVTG